VKPLGALGGVSSDRGIGCLTLLLRILSRLKAFRRKDGEAEELEHRGECRIAPVSQRMAAVSVLGNDR